MEFLQLNRHLALSATKQNHSSKLAAGCSAPYALQTKGSIHEQTRTMSSKFMLRASSGVNLVEDISDMFNILCLRLTTRYVSKKKLIARALAVVCQDRRPIECVETPIGAFSTSCKLT